MGGDEGEAGGGAGGVLVVVVTLVMLEPSHHIHVFVPIGGDEVSAESTFAL